MIIIAFRHVICISREPCRAGSRRMILIWIPSCGFLCLELVSNLRLLLLWLALICAYCIQDFLDFWERSVPKFLNSVSVPLLWKFNSPLKYQTVWMWFTQLFYQGFEYPWKGSVMVSYCHNLSANEIALGSSLNSAISNISWEPMFLYGRKIRALNPYAFFSCCIEKKYI